MNTNEGSIVSKEVTEKITKYSSDYVVRGLELAYKVQSSFLEEFKPSQVDSEGFEEQDLDVLFSIGLDSYVSGSMKEAAATFKKILKHNPDHIDAFCFLVFALDSTGENHNLFEAFEKIAQHVPTHENLHILYAQGLYCYAIDDQINFESRFSDALKLTITSLSKYASLNMYFRSAIQYLKGNKSIALIELDQAIKINPNNVIALLLRGHINHELGNYSSAIYDLTQALTVNPNHDRADKTLFIRARSFCEIWDFESAIKDYTAALELNPENINYWVNRGERYFSLNRFIEAEQDINHALNLDPHLQNKELKNFLESLEINNLFQELDWIVTAFTCMGDVHYKLENYQDAIEDYTYALNFSSSSTDIYNKISSAYIMLNSYQEAMECLQKAMSSSNDQENQSSNLNALNILARLLKSIKRIAKKSPEIADDLTQEFLANFS